MSDISSNKGRCVFAGCAKNCANYLPSVFNNIMSVSKLFSEICVMVAHDSSADNTLDVLNHIKSKIPCEMLIVEPVIPPNPVDRVEKLCISRNTLLDTIRNGKWRDWEYMIIIDLDDVCSLPINIEPIRELLDREDWDSVSFNLKDYYDIWALAYKPYVISCWNWGPIRPCSSDVVKVMKRDISIRLSLLPPNALFSCDSAFNGFALYRLHKFLDCKYTFIEPEFDTHNPADVDTSIKRFNKLCPSAKQFFIYPNQQYGKITCEHRAFHREAIAKNGAKIRISPKHIF